jgi:hypothetical protein
VIAAVAAQTLLGPLTGWMDHREREAISYLIDDTASCSLMMLRQRVESHCLVASSCIGRLVRRQ